MTELEKRLIISELNRILSKAEEHDNYTYTMNDVKDGLRRLIKQLSFDGD